VSGLDEKALLEKLRSLEAEKRELELQLSTCRRERTDQAKFAVAAEDRASYAERELMVLKPMLRNLYGMLEWHDQRTSLDRWPDLKQYVS